MKRTFAVVVMAVTAGTSLALAAPVHASSAVSAVSAVSAATAPAAAAAAGAAVLAASAKAKPQVVPGATLRVVPSWTYRDGGKLAVIATCSWRHDLRVITSRMLRHPVLLGRRGNLLVKLTGKTNTGKYAITLWCVNKQHLPDAMAVKSVKILKRFGSYKMPSPPRLPKHFKPAVTVAAGPPAPAKAPLGKKAH